MILSLNTSFIVAKTYEGRLSYVLRENCPTKTKYATKSSSKSEGI